MKKIIIPILLCVISSVCFADDFIAPKRNNRAVFTDTTTTHTYRIDETKYDVYKSKSGAFYIWKVSKKTGKAYKYYLPKDIQIQMGRQYNN